MIERMDDLPTGVIGLRVSGKLTRDDYRDVMEPALKEAVDSGEARVLFVLPDFDGLEPKAWIEDVKTGLGVELRNRSAWKRLADGDHAQLHVLGGEQPAGSPELVEQCHGVADAAAGVPCDARDGAAQRGRLGAA